MRALMALARGRGALTTLAAALVLAVVVEVLFLRTFARAGIYIFQKTRSEAVYEAYTLLVQVGLWAVNFALLTALVLAVVLSLLLWRRGGGLQKAAATLLALAVASELTLVFLSSAWALQVTYLAVSGVGVLVIGLLWLRRSPGPWMTAGLLLLLVAVVTALWYKLVPLLHQAGLSQAGGALVAVRLSETALVLAAVALVPAVGIVRRPRVIAGASVPTILVAGMYMGNPDMLPLIATWAFGITMYLPIWVYLAAMWSGLAVLFSLAEGRSGLLACGLALLFLGHRMLPLTYFNDLALVGMAAVSLAPWPRTAPAFLGLWGRRPALGRAEGALKGPGGR